ncbi:MAG: BrnT family toxin [Rhodocyclales bacterium]|nr:BrnT family toxin [Rhodocyclales bacterium]
MELRARPQPGVNSAGKKRFCRTTLQIRGIDITNLCSYIKSMRIEFDPAKDRANISAHGVSLSLASELDWDAALVWVDDRFEYDEVRMIALAPETEILYYVAFVDRGEALRIISLRRATRREVKHYAENF